MDKKGVRPTADPNVEVIVMEMRRQPVKERGLCFSWRLTKTLSRENRGRGAAAKTVGILSTQDMYAVADLYQQCGAWQALFFHENLFSAF